MNTHQGLFRSTTIHLLLRNFFTFVSILTTIFLVRTLGPNDYGKWSLVWQSVGFAGPLLSMGFLVTLAKFFPELSEAGQKALFAKTFSWISSLALLATTVWYGGFAFFKNILPVEFLAIQKTWILFVITIGFVNLWEGFYRGKGRFNHWTVWDGIRSNLASLTAVGMILLLGKKFEYVWNSYFIISLFYICIFFFINRKILHFGSFAIERPIVHFNVVQLCGQLVFTGIMLTDPLIIRYLLKDPSAVAFYDVGIRIPRILESFLLSPLSVPFLYYFSQKQTPINVDKIITFGGKFLGICFGVASLGLFTFRQEIISLLFGSDYVTSSSVLAFYCFVPCLSAMQSMPGVYFNSINKPLIPNIIIVLAYVVLVVLDFILIPVMGVKGAACAGLITLLFSVGCMTFQLPSREVFKITFQIIATIAACALIDFFFLAKTAPFLFVALVAAQKLITRQELEKIWTMAKASRKKNSPQ